MKRFCKKYLRDTSGNFAMMFAVAIVPVLMAAGMAIDISRLQAFDRQMQDALDSAVLQAVQLATDDDDELDRITRNIFEANLNYPGMVINSFDATAGEDGSVTIDARAQIPAKFAQVFGHPRMMTVAESGADADSGGDLELVIAFDTTNSMGFDNTWTNALNTLDTVLDEIDEYSGENNFFVSMVPFSDRVNVGTSRTNWLQGGTPANWNGCVEPREEDNGTVTWALDDDKPTGQNRFIGSVPGVTGGLGARGGGYPFCPSVSIVPPTNDVETVINAAAAFTKSGTGRFDVGMAWAWRMMSSEWRGHWSAGGNAAANNGHDRRQIAIMITDGRTNAYDYEVGAANSWGNNEGSVEGFENMVAICDEMRADNMEVFMVRVDGNVHAAQYMKSCATSDDHYFEITDNAGLEIAFKDILKVVKSNVRLTN